MRRTGPSALSCALSCVLCGVLTALPAETALADGHHHIPPPDGLRIDDGKGDAGVRAAKRALDRIYRQAAVTTGQYEDARRAVQRQQRTVAALQRSVRFEQDRLDMLRQQLGRMAAEQYRNGGDLGTTAELLLVARPRDFLDGLLLIDRCQQTAAQLLSETRDAERRTRAQKRRADEALARLDRELERQRLLKLALETKLARAERRLEQLERLQRLKRPKDGGPVQVPHSGGGIGGSVGCGGGRAVAGHDRAGSPDDGRPSARHKWHVPVRGYRLTARFGQSSNHWSDRHTGLDFAVPQGRRVMSAGFGTVYALRCGDAFGNSVTVKHDDGYFTFYAHLSAITARPGERVFPGEPIGLSGTTGNSTGPHLHFEVRVTPAFGSGIDPEPWLKARGVDPDRLAGG